MRAFKTGYNGIVYYTELSTINHKRIKFYEKNCKNCDFGYRIDTYNYVDSTGNLITELEDYYAGLEDKKSKVLFNLIKEIDNNVKNRKLLNKNEKVRILSIMMILYEKMAYYHTWLFMLEESDTITEDKFIFLIKHTIFFKLYWWSFLIILLEKPFKRILVYSRKSIFYFGDVPIHITVNGDNNSLEDFYNHEGSNIFFPISKNIGIYIENNQDNSISDTLIYIQREGLLANYSNDNLDETVESAIIGRGVMNCNEYIAGPFKKSMKKAIKSRKQNSIYRQDVFIYATKEKNIVMPIYKDVYKELSGISKDIINDYLHEEILKNMVVLKYIDKELMNMSVSKYLTFITGMDCKEVNRIIKNNEYKKILSNPEFYIEAIKNIAKVLRH